VGLDWLSGKAHKLNAMQVKKLSSPGRYADGNCLYLTISESGSKSWLLRIVVRGRRRDMGLGSVDLVSLEEARDLARQYRRIARSGGDPLLDRQALRGQLISFREAAVQVHELNVPSWGNDKHASQWLSSLEIHVFPIIGSMPVSQITSADVLKVLAPIWIEKADTAKKIRQRLRMIIKWARAQGYFTGDDPVELAEQALPKVKASGAHFRSVSYDDLPEIIDRLHASSVSLATRLALEFLILTASRTTEVLEAHWSEIDLDKKLWVIPAERMKASRDHEVPLTERMIEILQTAAELKLDNGLIFPSALNGKAMSNNTLRLALQKRLGVDATVHGMRSAFKDWAAETTTYPNEVSEMALAHSIGSKVEAAYRRGNLLTKRRQMMADWDAFLTGKDRKVIQLHEKGDAR
jgi:integrase